MIDNSNPNLTIECVQNVLRIQNCAKTEQKGFVYMYGGHDNQKREQLFLSVKARNL